MVSSSASARSKSAESVLSIYISSSSSSEGDSDSEDSDQNDDRLSTIPELVPTAAIPKEMSESSGERKSSYRNFVSSAFTRIFPRKTSHHQTDVETSSSSSNTSSRPPYPLKTKTSETESFHHDNIETDIEAEEADPTVLSLSSSNSEDEKSAANEVEPLTLSTNHRSATFESQTTASVNNTTANRIKNLVRLASKKTSTPPQDIEVGMEEKSFVESYPVTLFSCLSLFLGIILGMIISFAIFSQTSQFTESKAEVPPIPTTTQAPASSGGGFQFTTSSPSQAPIMVAPTSRDDTQAPSASPSILSPVYSASNATNSISCPPFPSAEPLAGKKGIGLLMNREGQPGSWVDNLPKLNSLNPSWYHSWGYNLPDAVSSNVEYVPMLPDVTKYNLTDEEFQQHFAEPVSSGKVKHVMGPDDPLLEDTSVEDVIQSWSRLEALGVPLTSPSLRQTLGPWMKSFMNETESGCSRVDWIGVKWYGRPSPEAFRQRMRKLYKAYERPLLLTEFAPRDDESGNGEPLSRAQVLAFMKAVLPWMEEQAWIIGYAWYPFDTGSVEGHASALFHTNGDLTELGLYYASITTTNPTGDLTIMVA